MIAVLEDAKELRGLICLNHLLNPVKIWKIVEQFDSKPSSKFIYS